ncbi:MAG: hypothetical protein IT428_06720 [Planctomycetaceae bacterium]|nr:hypothetical protein [Planctomycetaceae bacterium]
MKSTKSGIPGIRLVGNPVPTLPVAVPVAQPLSTPTTPGEMLDVFSLTGVPVDVEGVTPTTEAK